MIISIVMATYNGCDHLGEQLSSLASQSHPPDELIISEDNSTDSTKVVLESFREHAPFPVHIHYNSERVGYGINFSNAALRARGDIILFCDQDDVWRKEKVETIFRFFKIHPEEMLVSHNIAICDAKLNIIIPNYFSYLRSNLFGKKRFFKGCAMAITRRLRDAAFPLPQPSDWRHDGRAAVIAETLGTRNFIPDVLIDHRLHSGNTSGYIVPKKSFGGRLLSFLDSQALRSASGPYFATTMLPLPVVATDLLEIFAACERAGNPKFKNRKELLSLRIASRVNARHKAHQTRKVYRALLNITALYIRSGYNGIGGIYLYTADVLRLLRPSRHGQEFLI
jgi:glycosyltransferase involved in cell wall biosynthesis